VVLNMPNAGGNHVSGWIGFGPDGLLYIPHGDNGSDSNSQNMTTLRGKILRIDVDGPDNIPGNADDDGFPTDNDKLYTIPSTNPYVTDPDVPDEIWVSGVRNPYRCSFDTETGDLWVCDVGGGFREEVNRLTTSSGGANLGWPCAEGNIVWQPQCFQSIVNYTPPMFD
ncbi:MAG: PQQ-dependent sugar dehydrogenase, partial [Phycisphaerales bacterium]